MTPNDGVDGVRSGSRASTGSVGSALRLLEMFRGQQVVRVTDAAAELGVARSTAHRLLQVLSAHDFAVQDEGRAYRPGPALVGLAVTLVDGLDLRSVAAPIMVDLAQELGETVHLSVLQGTQILFVHSVESSRTLRVGIRTGGTLPAYATAAGRVALAFLPDDDDRRRPPRSGWTAVTSRTITDATRIEHLLDEARDRGYATSFGETEEDVASVAVPVLDAAGAPLAALALSAPPARLREDMAPTRAAVLATAARRIGELLPAGR
ncbi:IclR family transcriptional regulator [Georgenia sp. Z1491]|uniref:IclR family transcriptional regulator n=1 Tax=Georgenia sp. Z1491 TaxID=3416707 RepID=UPI003CF732EB